MIKELKLCLLEEHTRVKLYYLGLGNGFLDRTPKAEAATTTTTKIDQLDFVKMKKLMCVKGFL